MDTTQHTPKRRPPTTNLDLQNHAKTNHPKYQRKNSDSKTEYPFKNPLTPSSNPQKIKKAKNHVLISKPLKTRTKPKQYYKRIYKQKKVLNTKILKPKSILKQKLQNTLRTTDNYQIVL